MNETSYDFTFIILKSSSAASSIPIIPTSITIAIITISCQQTTHQQ